MKNVIVAFVSQKGGVGKSTLARAFSTGASKAGQLVKMADLDTQQATITDWHRQRLDNGYSPVGSVEVFSSVPDAVRQAGNFDFLIFDGSARASKTTLEVAKLSNLVVIPACSSRDDLVPAIKLAHELQKRGVPKKAIVLALTRVSTDSEIADARTFIQESGQVVLEGHLPEKAGYRQAQNDGLSILETRFKSLNQRSNELMDAIINYLL